MYVFPRKVLLRFGVDTSFCPASTVPSIGIEFCARPWGAGVRLSWDPKPNELASGRAFAYQAKRAAAFVFEEACSCVIEALKDARGISPGLGRLASAGVRFARVPARLNGERLDPV